MPDEHFSELEAATTGLRREPIGAGPSLELAARTAAAMKGGSERSHRRRWAIGAAAAAVVVVGLGSTIIFIDRATPLAFAEVVQQVAAAEQAQRTMTFTDATGQSHGYLKGTHQRVDGYTPDGVGHWTAITDDATGDHFMIIPEQHTAYWHHHVPKSSSSVYEILRDVARRAVQPIGEREVAGVKLAGFSGSMRATDTSGKPYDVPVKIWVDPRTRLPRIVEQFDPLTGKADGTFADIQFDVPLEDELFEFKAPEGFKLQDFRAQDSQPLRPPPSTQPADAFVLKPGVGMGDLKLGDPLDRVVALLGLPEKDDDEIYDGFKKGKLIGGTIYYPSLGLRIFVALDKRPDATSPQPLAGRRIVVHSIWVDDANPLWAGRAFAGSTSEGIRLGSPRAEVNRIYGKADWENAGNAEYRRRGLAVFYHPGDNRVSGVLITAASDKPIFAEASTEPSTRP